MAGISSTPRDGGRGKEWRHGLSVVRWFSAKHGYVGAWVGRNWLTLRWFVGWKIRNSGTLLGVYVYRDEDGDVNVEVGLWLVAWHYTHHVNETAPKDWPNRKVS